MTYDDIYPGVMEFQARIISEKEISPGRYHREYKGENFIPTPSGKMQEDEWTKLALKLIHENGDDQEFQKLMDHVSSLPWMKREPEIRKEQYAAERLIRRICKNERS